jgi:hypothetical protein
MQTGDERKGDSEMPDTQVLNKLTEVWGDDQEIWTESMRAIYNSYANSADDAPVAIEGHVREIDAPNPYGEPNEWAFVFTDGSVAVTWGDDPVARSYEDLGDFAEDNPDIPID